MTNVVNTSGEGEGGSRGIALPVFLAVAFVLIVLGSIVVSAATNDPSGPTGIQSISNLTKSPAAAQLINISGGYIGVFNLTANIQDPRWKGFVGNVTGSFTLTDGTSSVLYNWQLASLTGSIFATRNSTTINWAAIQCASAANLTVENNALNLTNPSDNITSTFNVTATVTHPFTVGSTTISGTCPVLYTYVNSASQNVSFQETALYANPSIVYSTLLEQGVVGFNGQRYDFQEIVPNNGTVGSAPTPYYLYIELGN